MTTAADDGPFRLGDVAADGLVVVVVIVVITLAVTGVGVDSDFGDPDPFAAEFLLALPFDDVLMAVELRTLTEFRLILPLDGGGG